MSRIRGKNTLLELSGFELLKKTNLRFRRHPRGIYGKPDAALKNRKIAVFFDSEFWHGFKFKEFKKRLPNDYWVRKIENNRRRDKLVTKELKKNGWTVIRFWESELFKKPEDCLKEINSFKNH